MMNATALLPAVATASALFLAGLGGGLAFFQGLRMTVALFVAGDHWFAPVAITVVRIAGIITLFSVATYFGAFALIACLLGFSLARAIAVRTAPENG
jgi:hypothetical protein